MYIAVLDGEKVIATQEVPSKLEVDGNMEYVELTKNEYDMYQNVTDLYYINEVFKYEEPVVQEPTEEELINAEILLNQVDIIAKQNEHDEVLAEILLNQMGV